MVALARPGAAGAPGAGCRALSASSVVGVAPERPCLPLRALFDAVFDAVGRLVIAIFSMTGMQHGKRLAPRTAARNVPEIKCAKGTAHAIGNTMEPGAVVSALPELEGK